MPRPPRPQAEPGDYASTLQQSIQALSAGGVPAPEEPDFEEVQESEAGLDYSADGGEEAESADGEWGRSPDVVSSSSPPLPPKLPSPLSPDELASQVIAALKQQGIPVTDGVIQGAISQMATNIQAGIVQDVGVSGIVGTAVRMNMRHVAAEAGAASNEATTRTTVMAEPKFPWRHEKSFKVTINGWVMRVPANRSVMVPRSVLEVLQNAVTQDVIVKSMQMEMYHRMTGIPQPVDDPNMYEGYDDHNMRVVQ